MVNLHTKRRTGWCALLCAICIIFGLMGSATPAYAAAKGHVYGSSEKAEPGGEVSIFFGIQDNPGIWGMKGTVSYDTSVMTLKSVSAGKVFSSSELILPETMGNPFTFLATGSTIADKTKNGAIVHLKFAINENAKLGSYSVSIKLNQVINANEQDVPLTTASAKIQVVSCMHSKTVVKNAVEATETTEGYSGDTYCKKCDTLVKKGSTVAPVVNTCEHKNTTITVVAEPNCTTDGKSEMTCNDCNKLLQETVISKTGHERTVTLDQKAATTTEEGFTGNVYCEKCNALLQEGTVIPKIQILVFNMTTQAEDTYYKDSQAGLVFVSDAEVDTFVRVEIDGSTLAAEHYTVESGSTKVTLSSAYLKTLSDGKHTITIVSDAGTASAQFQVAQNAPEPEVPVEEEKELIPYHILLIITIVAVVIAIGCLVYVLIVVAKKAKNGRYSDNHEE